jgi:uncharacterized protein YjbI with pentapeptide repeats
MRRPVAGSSTSDPGSSGARIGRSRVPAVVLVWRRRDREARRFVAANANHADRDLGRRRLVAMDLRRKSFRGANLAGADLTEADLGSADLTEADLRGAYLTGAQMVGANLSGACLDGAYLIATNLRGAILAGASFDGAIWDQATTWPDGSASARRPKT